MTTMIFTPAQIEKWKLRAPAFNALAERYRSDAALRSRIDGGDMEDALSDLELALPPGIEVRVAVNTADTFHVVMPPDPNIELSDEALAAVAGGKSAGSAGSVGTAGTMGCSSSPSSVSTAGTGGTAGSAS